MYAVLNFTLGSNLSVPSPGPHSHKLSQPCIARNAEQEDRW
jgi:hypothetical protein